MILVVIYFLLDDSKGKCQPVTGEIQVLKHCEKLDTLRLLVHHQCCLIFVFSHNKLSSYFMESIIVPLIKNMKEIMD